ncbi:protein terminal ear1 homolog [Amborella trichopoda]|uniref:protein terminal ear1 homolog n=1 Tax=Amborella trichopoda TaxID=13333 RepID=UPI0009C0091C|nr:protein terminal ear1 homolog [Amborella trichopoda]|eukprot:XP_020528229.1 protein terminal ear1 homolog [Amborella trichopoda]
METPGARAAVMEIPNERVENKETFDKSQGERFICWRPKARYGEKSRNRHDKFRERSDNDLNPFKIKEIDGQHSTVMIKNIPNKCSWRRLLDFLDEHCIQENEKIKKVGSNAQEMFSEYDFLYLPMDFKNKCNLGYAFVNFTSAMGAWKLYNKLNGYQWKVYSSKKICEVTYARIQGKQALVKHFCGSTFMCNCDDYLPHLFSPPRNGSALSESITVGRRLHRFHP